MDTDIDGKLARIFDADRALRRAQQEFFTETEEAQRLPTLARALDAAIKLANDAKGEEEGVDRMVRLAELLTEVGGPEGILLLVRLLDQPDDAVRASAFEGLVDLGHSRYAEVARTFEKAVEDGKATVALTEIPYVLAEIGEPGGARLCLRLLKHAEGDVVAAAIEALAALGHTAALKDIEKLRADKRKVTMEDGMESGELTVGELAAEAVEHLRAMHD